MTIPLHQAATVSYSDFIECGSEEAAKDKGKLRIEGKDYVVWIPDEEDGFGFLKTLTISIMKQEWPAFPVLDPSRAFKEDVFENICDPT